MCQVEQKYGKNLNLKVKSTVSQLAEPIASSRKNMKPDENQQKSSHELVLSVTKDEHRFVEELRRIGDNFNEAHGQEIEHLLGVLPSTSEILHRIFWRLVEGEEFSWARRVFFNYFGAC
ncbi:unnamed protein product [Hymenolepis diminuta]|uniref:Uncharacterized protein n=1 Tax=Hymenolepis diminuta TaxID=6216 RepID=A0A564Y2P9_HYMDI|nr:unnamed protein product [Hymenolepis diminuta]